MSEASKDHLCLTHPCPVCGPDAGKLTLSLTAIPTTKETDMPDQTKPEPVLWAPLNKHGNPNLSLLEHSEYAAGGYGAPVVPLYVGEPREPLPTPTKGER